MKDEKKFWVALSTSDKIGARTFAKLYKRFKKLEKVWQASRDDLSSAGLDLGQITAIEEIVKKVDPEREMEKLGRLNIDVLIFPDDKYPRLLKEIPDPPGVLYVKGEITPEDETALAVVGSRKYTEYGERAVDKLVGPLTRAKITVISGLALGIDALAHKAALDAGGRTIGVLACGLDQIYPISNTRLADKIISGHGAVISEFPLGMPALRYNFPIRNRIIAGMSLGTVIIEGAAESGSLITAQAALEYNREVFAVPGSIFSETSVAPNLLIQMGAKIVLDANDILTELDLADNLTESVAREIIADTANEEILLKLLKRPTIVDELIKESNLAASEVNTTLVMMEMKGMVTNLGGTRYVIRGKLKEN